MSRFPLIIFIGLLACEAYAKPSDEPPKSIEIKNLKSSVESAEGNSSDDFRFGAASAFKVDAPKTLDDLLEIPGRKSLDLDTPREMQHRIGMVRRAGFEVGLARGYEKAISEYATILENRSSMLDQVFAFEEIFQIANHDLPPEQSLYRQPPIVSLLKDVIEVGEGGQYLKTIDGVFRIISKEKFVPQPPRWQEYLVPPVRTSDTAIYAQTLWSTREERLVWKEAVAMGWQQGLLQADEEMRHRVEILGRDYLGMLSYIDLKFKGKMSPGYIASKRKDVDGGGDELTVGNRSFQISNPTGLNADSTQWKTAIQANANSAYENQGVKVFYNATRCTPDRPVNCL